MGGLVEPVCTHVIMRSGYIQSMHNYYYASGSMASRVLINIIIIIMKSTEVQNYYNLWLYNYTHSQEYYVNSTMWFRIHTNYSINKYYIRTILSKIYNNGYNNGNNNK